MMIVLQISKIILLLLSTVYKMTSSFEVVLNELISKRKTYEPCVCNTCINRKFDKGLIERYKLSQPLVGEYCRYAIELFNQKKFDQLNELVNSRLVRKETLKPTDFTFYDGKVIVYNTII